jgi:uncharacterized membrane protein YeaQ/YmgE (transglycosylase-associated protein family)
MDATILIIWAVVGAVIGWLASQIMTKGSFGIQGDIMVGVGSAVVGGLLFPAIGFRLGGQAAELLGHIVNSALGAVIGTFVGRLVLAQQQPKSK